MWDESVNQKRYFTPPPPPFFFFFLYIRLSSCSTKQEIDLPSSKEQGFFLTSQFIWDLADPLFFPIQRSDKQCVQGPGTNLPPYGWPAITSDSGLNGSDPPRRGLLRPPPKLHIFFYYLILKVIIEHFHYSHCCKL